MKDAPAFYVESAAGPCMESGCEKYATHKVMRRGKVNYGSFCKRDADKTAKRLNAQNKTDHEP